MQVAVRIAVRIAVSPGNLMLDIMQELEEHYYSSRHRRPLEAEAPGEHAGALTALCRTALDVPLA